MANANESATQSQINELVADIGQKLSALSAEEIGRLHGKKDQFVEQCGAVATKLSQLEPAAPPAHETIRIPCTIGSRKYLACGFLKAGEPSVKGRTKSSPPNGAALASRRTSPTSAGAVWGGAGTRARSRLTGATTFWSCASARRASGTWSRGNLG